jgi:putative transposase
MPRRPRIGSAGQIFHVINRGVRKSILFDTDADFRSFEKLLVAARERVPLQIQDFCLMWNHFHLVLSPQKDGDLSEFMRWLTVTHARRRHAQKGTTGTGAIYQGRFKAFAVQNDRHFLRVCRYVERNPLRAGMVERAEEWRWSSLWHHCNNSDLFVLDPWPIPRPADWVTEINMAEADVEAIRASVRSGKPYGESDWVEQAWRT